MQLTSAPVNASVALLTLHVGAGTFRFLYERRIELNLSGNEVYYANSPILLAKNMLCSKLHCQKGFNLKKKSCQFCPQPRLELSDARVYDPRLGTTAQFCAALVLKVCPWCCSVVLLTLHVGAGTFRFIYKKIIKLKLSGNEVYYANCLILLAKNMLCSKLHCQKGFGLIMF